MNPNTQINPQITLLTTCNCRQKNLCPLNGNFLHLQLSDSQKTPLKLGTETTLHHSVTQNTGTLRNSVKDNNSNYSISWRIISSNSSYNSSNKRCHLCLKGKFLIICRPDLSSLYKRNELVSSCRHRNKALLRNN